MKNMELLEELIKKLENQASEDIWEDPNNFGALDCFGNADNAYDEGVLDGYTSYVRELLPIVKRLRVNK